MVNKMCTAAEAVSAIKDGDVIAVGGFLGTGSPEILMDALVAQGTKHLTVIANDGGLNEENAPTNGKLKGIGKLLRNHQIDVLIASHIGVNPDINRQINEGTLKYVLYPQGTLAEKLRCAGAGMGGFYTRAGVSTLMEEEHCDTRGHLLEKTYMKEKKIVDGKEYLFELPLKPKFSLVRADFCDKFGNFAMLEATKNFNHVMAMAAEHTILASEKVFEIGEKEPDFYQVSGVLVEKIVEGEPAWQI